MLDVLQASRINSDVADEDLKPGEYRDALNISSIANEIGAFTKGTTFGNIDTNIVFKGLQPDAICLGTAIDHAGQRMIITFYQRVPIPFTEQYEGVINYATSRGFQLPSPRVQAAQNYFSALLKAEGILSGLDKFMCFFGDGDADFAAIDWLLPNDATSAVNHGMIYDHNYGFKGNPVAGAYLDTKWVPSAGVKFTQNNGTFVVGYEEIFEGSVFDGCSDVGSRNSVWPLLADGQIRFSINSGVGEVEIIDDQFTDAPGLYFCSRISDNDVVGRKNSGTSFTMVEDGNARPTRSFYLGAHNSNGLADSFSVNRYGLFAAGEYLNTFDRENKFYDLWQLYKNSFVTELVTETHTQEVLMYLITDKVGGVVSPLIRSSLMNVSERSYLDGYTFINDLFYFNFRESAPKGINIKRALDSPGFYDKIAETSLTVIKPHPPFAPVVARQLGVLANDPIQKKPFQFMMVYNFVDGEQSTKSPASEYLNSLDDTATLTSNYDRIRVTMSFPQKDYSIVDNIELFVRNNNAIADWRSVNVFSRTQFVRAGENYQLIYQFFDNAVGNFLPIELGTKINDSVPQLSNYLAFIENRIFLIDSLLDYDFSNAFQILITLDEGNPPLPDDRLAPGILYGLAEFEYDSEYTVGLAFYDKYGRKYPSSTNDKKLVTPPFVTIPLPASGADDLPDQRIFPQLKKPKITAKYDLRAAGNIANYGKPPKFAHWWGMIRTKNTKWEFQQSIHCVLRFPYSVSKWFDTDPAKFPDPNLFLEDNYLYWHVEKLLYGTSGGGLNITQTMVNDYIDIVVPLNFPYPLDNQILVDFMLDVTTEDELTRVRLLNRECIETFSNKIRVRGDRAARWFSNAGAGVGQFKEYPKFTTGVNLSGEAVTGIVLRNDEVTFPLIIKRRRKNNLESIILYDTPDVYPVTRPNTKLAVFQPQQTSTIERAEYEPVYIAPSFTRTLSQGDILIQPILLTPTTAAVNHKIKIEWGANTGDALRLKIKVSIWQLNDLNQPIIELYSATRDAGGPYKVRDSEVVEYPINLDAEFVTGWLGYGVQILEAVSSNVQFENPDFDTNTVTIEVDGWLQSPEGLSALLWKQDGVAGENFAFVNVSDMGTGFSKTLYQLLLANSDELTFEVVVESVGLQGPIENAPITQYPGNTQTPVVSNWTEQLFDLNRVVAPYYIDCDSPEREVTLEALTYTLNTGAPVGATIRAEVWLLNQTTKQPISMISGSEGASQPLPTAPGTYSVPFGATNLINTSGWYGMALYVDLPTFADFTDKNYTSGGSAWTVKAGTPTWAFAGDTTTSDVFGDVVIDPPWSSVIGRNSIKTPLRVAQPIFFAVGTDPAGYSNHRVVIDWGDNGGNGWSGKTITAAIWDVNQTTRKPLSTTPIMQASITIGSNAVVEHFISNASMLLGNKWYAFGLHTPTGHLSPTGTQFTNHSFSSGLASWTFAAGAVNASFSGLASNYMRVGGSPGSFDTSTIYQALPGYVQVTLPWVLRGSSGFSSISVQLMLNGVAVQTINLTAQFAAGNFASVVFEPVYANGGNVGIRFFGTASGGYFIDVYGIYNTFNAYLYSTPKVCTATISNADYENWISWISPTTSNRGPVDPTWSNAMTFWKMSDEGKVGASWVQLKEGKVGDDTADSIFMDFMVPTDGVSPFLYGILDMGDAPSTLFNYSIGGIYSLSGGNLELQFWAFNDPTDIVGSGEEFATEVFTTSPPSLNFDYNHSVTIPGGYKYFGIRMAAQTGGSGVVQVSYNGWYPASGTYSSWSKNGSIYIFYAKERQLISAGGFVAANFHADNITPLTITAKIGQPLLIGTLVRANIELFGGSAPSSYTLLLYDGNDVLLGSTSVVGQAMGANPQISVDVVNVPTTTGLFLAVRNDNSSGNFSVRIRQITNVNAPVFLAAGTGVANAKTWRIDASNNMAQLSTTSVTLVTGTDDVPQPAFPVTVVLADAAGVEISAPQTFVANDGPKTLIFTPDLAVAGNFNYGLKVKNNPLNGTIAGTIRVHSVQNISSNEGEANIIGNTIDPAHPLYEAWNQFSLGAFVRAGYVSNFIAVVDDIIVSAFDPVAINPTSYHLVAYTTPAGVPTHSDTYLEPYNFGIAFPSIASDPDAKGIVYEQKTGQSIGDINIKIIDQRQRSQSNIVRWSDPVIAGTRINNLNSFLDGNKYSVDFQRGAIQVMIAMHDHTLFCVHTQGMSSLYINRSIMISPSEVQSQDDQLFLTNKIVGSDNKLTGNLGTVNPESCRVVESGTIAYGFDLIRKSFWQKTNNGIRNLTYECNAKKFFNEVCKYRLPAFNEGEDVKIYSGYNEKEKSFFLTFAPFIYRGQPYPGITIAYNAYIDGFLSRYSFEPMSYVAFEDVLHTVKAREFNNPDFQGRFDFWKTIAPNALHTAGWFKSLTNPAGAKAITTVPAGTRILNPDFIQGLTFWEQYGTGGEWAMDGEGVSAVVVALEDANDLVNSSGAPGTYSIRLNATLPVTGFNYTLKVYDEEGDVVEVLQDATPMTGDDVVMVTQTLAGRIGVLISNTTEDDMEVHMNLFTTVVKTNLLYQPIPIIKEGLRMRILIPARLGSIKVMVYAFNDPSDPFMTLLQTVSQIRVKDTYVLNVNVDNPEIAKYIGLYAVTDYDLTTIGYFNVNSIPSIWRHDQVGKTNNFFGVQYDSMIDLVFGVEAGQVRIFNSLGIMSGKAWSVETFETSEGQFSMLAEDNFRLRDGIYSAHIMRDILSPQDSLPDPINNTPLMHGAKLFGTSIRMVLRNAETLRQIELSSVYLGSDELAGNLLGKK